MQLLSFHCNYDMLSYDDESINWRQFTVISYVGKSKANFELKYISSSSISSVAVEDHNIRYIDAMGTYHYTRNSSDARKVDITFDAMKMNNYSDSLCLAEKYSSDLHVKNMGLMFTLVESYKLPYWHNRGLARI